MSKMDKILDQGIFASKREMSQLEAAKNSIHSKLTAIAFENNVSNKNKMQTVKYFYWMSKTIKKNTTLLRG